MGGWMGCEGGWMDAWRYGMSKLIGGSMDGWVNCG